MDEEIKKIQVEGEEKPPLFKNWKTWYMLVIGNMFLLVILFYIFTKVFE